MAGYRSPTRVQPGDDGGGVSGGRESRMSRRTGRGKVVLFTGPTGAGKTTCAQAWAASRQRHTGWFDHDDARFILKSGYLGRSTAAADESLRPEADRQWLLGAAVCEAVAETYVEAGI